VGSKANKQWLIYAYDRESKEIVAYVLGDRSVKTANKLRKKLKELGITYDRIATDNWKAFIAAFKKSLTSAEHDIGKQYTNGIEGNNCLLRLSKIWDGLGALLSRTPPIHYYLI